MGQLLAAGTAQQRRDVGDGGKAGRDREHDRQAAIERSRYQVREECTAGERLLSSCRQGSQHSHGGQQVLHRVHAQNRCE